MSMTINTACRICKSTTLTKVIDLGSQPLANAFLRKEMLGNPEPTYPLEVYVCEECNLAQLIHVVDKEVLFSDYIYFSSGMPKLSDHFRRYAEDVIARFLKDTKSLVVEVGSNDGILLHFFKEKGFRVVGVDPAKNIAPVAESRGVRTIVDFFSESVANAIVKEQGKAKAILGNNVIAHMNDYDDLGKGVKALLDTDGVFVFEAPYLLDMFENLTFDTIYHEHLNYLAIRPLLRLFAKYDLEIFAVEVVAAQGQSIRVFVGHKGVFPVEREVNDCIVKELDAGLHRIDAYEKLFERICRAKSEVVHLLQDLKQAGKRLAAYGAPAKGNTLLNFYGIGGKILDFALDELSAKQGLYTPGTHLPVIDRDEARAEEPDYYFLLAWNYKPVILEKEKAFLAGGGAFILPMTGEIIRN